MFRNDLNNFPFELYFVCRCCQNWNSFVVGWHPQWLGDRRQLLTYMLKITCFDSIINI